MLRCDDQFWITIEWYYFFNLVVNFSRLLSLYHNRVSTKLDVVIKIGILLALGHINAALNILDALLQT